MDHEAKAKCKMQNAEGRRKNGTGVSDGHRPPLQDDFAFCILHFALV
jgi:hypothetical protein